MVMGAFDENVIKSMRNIPKMDVILSRNINAYEVIRAEILLFTKDALSSLEEVFA